MFVVVVVDFTDLAVLCYLLITLKEKKLWDLSSVRMTPLVEVIEIVRMEQDFSALHVDFAWVAFGHVLGNDIQDTDRISFQIKIECFQISSIRFRVCIINDESSKTF